MPSGSDGGFDGDGRADIFWTCDSINNQLWLMNGADILRKVYLGIFVRPWMGDFNGDGRADILLEGSGGTLVINFMSSGVIIGRSTVSQPLLPGARIAKIADFNGDGVSDILATTSYGLSSVWLMSGEKVKATGAIQNLDSASWFVSPR